jgi:hypothetical protein
MACEFADSVQHYDSQSLMVLKYSSISGGSLTVDPSAGPRGGKCIKWASASNQPTGLFKDLKAVPTRFVGFRIYVNSTLDPGFDGVRLLAFYDSAEQQVSLDMSRTGILTARRGTGPVADFGVGTLLGTGSNPIPFGRWVYVGVKAVIDASAGIIQAYLGGDNTGTALIDLTAQNTRSSPNAWCNGIRFGFGRGGGKTAPTTYIADVYIANSLDGVFDDLQGDVAVYMRSDTADYSVEWTSGVSGSSNYQNVDEIPPDGDASENNSNNPGDIDLFEHESLPGDADAILAIARTIYAKHDGGGSGRVRTVVADAAPDPDQVEDNGEDLYVPASYGFMQGFHYTKPGSGSPGTAPTPTEFNNDLKVGYKNVSA